MPERRPCPEDVEEEEEEALALHADVMAALEEAEECEEDEEILAGDELQEVDFDVDCMEEADIDPTFHMMQRWAPVKWGVDLDQVLAPLQASPLTSIVKIPDDYNTGDEAMPMLNDNGEQVYGVVGLLNLAALRAAGSCKELFNALGQFATTEEASKPDVSALLTKEALQRDPVGLIVSERLTNLPPELGAQLHVNLFDELEAQRQEAKHPNYEHYLILVKGRMNADKELEELEERRAAAAAMSAGKKVKKQKAAAKSSSKRAATGAEEEKLAITEENTLFPRQEELYYFRHRDEKYALKRYTLDAELSKDVVIMPVVVHRAKLPALLKDIKSMDDYFATA